MKNTKIVATISGRRCDVPFLKRLFDAGMDAVRLNTAHMLSEEAKVLIRNVRSVSKTIPLIIDTKGPEVRTGTRTEALDVRTGQEVIFTHEGYGKRCSGNVVTVSYPKFVAKIAVKQDIYVDDASLCIARNDGTIKDNKSINVPGVDLGLPAISLRDRQYLRFAAEMDIDFVAHSFVRSKKDVLMVRKLLDKHNKDVKIIAKIEDAHGVANIDEIIEVADGIMVARGDLATEIPAEDVPIIQKSTIQRCLDAGKPVITATQMLHSMIEHPRPTRAEVSDVANAIFDGTDAVMLSGETANGKYPVEAVKMMTAIAKKVEMERTSHYAHVDLESYHEVGNYLAKSAVWASHELPTKAVVVATTSGASARILARYRGPDPIFARCFSPRVMRELGIVYGIVPTYLPKTTKPMVRQTLTDLLGRKALKKEDLIVLLTGIPGKERLTTTLDILTVSQALEKYP